NRRSPHLFEEWLQMLHVQVHPPGCLPLVQLIVLFDQFNEIFEPRPLDLRSPKEPACDLTFSFLEQSLCLIPIEGFDSFENRSSIHVVFDPVGTGLTPQSRRRILFPPTVNHSHWPPPSCASR